MIYEALGLRRPGVGARANPTHIKVSQLYIAIADKMPSTASGRLRDAVAVLGDLPVAEAEAALAGLLEREPMREMLLAYKNGVLVEATIGATKTKDAPKATAPVPEDMDLDGAVLTHTHPDGSPLSRGDVSAAHGKNMQEIRAVGRNGVFSLRRNKATWIAKPTAITEYYAMQGPAAWKAAAGRFVADPAKYRPNLAVPDTKRGATFAGDLCMGEHFACKELAARFKWIYEHPDEAQLAATRLALYEVRDATGSDKRAGFGGDTTPGKGTTGANEV